MVVPLRPDQGFEVQDPAAAEQSGHEDADEDQEAEPTHPHAPSVREAGPRVLRSRG